MAVVEIDPNSYKKISGENAVSVVWLYAKWCGPCNHFDPTFEAVANELVEGVGFYKYNVDQGPVEGPKIQGIPTIRVFKNGALLKEFVGVQEKNAFKGAIEQFKGER